MPIYKIYQCISANERHLLRRIDGSYIEAMYAAVHVAFERGTNKSAADIRGHFICVINEESTEVYRTSLAPDAEAETLRDVRSSGPFAQPSAGLRHRLRRH